MLKSSIRETLRKKRESLATDIPLRSGQRLLTYLNHYSHFQNWLLYAPIQNEISTRPVFDWIRKNGHFAYFPKITGEKMNFYRVDRWEELQSGGWIPEPTPSAEKLFVADNAVILIPGIAFSLGGQRLGFGKGHYDRYLKSNTLGIRLGIAYEFQVVLKPWESEDHDEPVDLVVTPAGVWGSSRTLL